MVGDDVLGAVVRLSADYARLVDNREATAWSELFAPDGCMDLGGRRITGRAALAEFAAAATAGVHTPGLPSVTVDGDRIESRSPFVFVSTGGTVLAGWYHDELTWDGDRLVFAVRRVDMRATSPARPG